MQDTAYYSENVEYIRSTESLRTLFQGASQKSGGTFLQPRLLFSAVECVKISMGLNRWLGLLSRKAINNMVQLT